MTVTRNKVYISGPMSSVVDFNYPLFNLIANKWEEQGWEVSNPAEKGTVSGWVWEDYLRHDVAELATNCKAIAMLPHWQDSKGARLEHHVAKALGMTIYDAITMEEMC